MPNRQRLNSFNWNPIAGWRNGEAYLQKHVDEECSKINSTSTAKLLEIVDKVTVPNDSIRSRTGIIAGSFWLCLAFDENDGVDPEALVRTVTSILDCLQSRLKGNFANISTYIPRN